MSFYEEIAPYYDDLFPLAQDAVGFVGDLVRSAPAGRVLDLACGSGRFARGLAAEGFSAVALDDAEAILPFSFEKSASGGEVFFVAGSMEALPFYGRGLFAAVVCLGNSLPHLAREEALERAIGECSRVLLPRGILVLQLLDFSRLARLGELTLPERSFVDERSGIRVVLRRRYSRNEGGVFFLPELEIGGGKRRYRLAMFPLEHGKLTEMMAECGLVREATYQGFSGATWQGTSDSYIVVARKTRSL